MFTEKTKKSQPKIPTKARLRNIALYYLERYETSVENLRYVLRKRIDKYAFVNKDYSPEQAYQWVEEVIDECVSHNFVSDERFTEFKVNSYLRAGKSRRYIEQKLKAKGIDEQIVNRAFDNTEYSEYDTALNFARKKKIACFRVSDDERKEMRQKDLATLVRAGFNYDVASEILNKNGDYL